MKTRDFHKQSLMSIFLSYFRPHLGLFLLDMACALAISLIDLAFPFISRLCLEELIPFGRYRTFFTVAAVLLGAYLLRSVLQYVVCFWGHTFGVLVEADIRRDLFALMARNGWPVLAPYRYTGETAGAVTAEEIPGTYKLVNHGRAITDEISLSVNITLGKDGRISCKENEDLSGTWALTGDSQAELTIDGRTYTGLFLVQWDEDGQKEVMTFTALDDETGMCVWGSGVNAR